MTIKHSRLLKLSSSNWDESGPHYFLITLHYATMLLPYAGIASLKGLSDASDPFPKLLPSALFPPPGARTGFYSSSRFTPPVSMFNGLISTREAISLIFAIFIPLYSPEQCPTINWLKLLLKPRELPTIPLPLMVILPLIITSVRVRIIGLPHWPSL